MLKNLPAREPHYLRLPIQRMREATNENQSRVSASASCAEAHDHAGHGACTLDMARAQSDCTAFVSFFLLLADPL